jgi:hypothetical protein
MLGDCRDCHRLIVLNLESFSDSRQFPRTEQSRWGVVLGSGVRVMTTEKSPRWELVGEFFTDLSPPPAEGRITRDKAIAGQG